MIPVSAHESDYPYLAVQGACQADKDRPFKAVTWGYVDSSRDIPTIDSLKKALCEDGPSLMAHEEFYFIDNKKFSSNSNVASVTFNLLREMYVSFVGDASAKIAKGSAPQYFRTGLHTAEPPNTIFTASYRKGTFQSHDHHNPVHTAFAMKLPEGTHTIYWKIWLNGYTIELDSGTLTAIAVPCSMGGKLKAESIMQSGIAGTVTEKDQIITTKDQNCDMLITVDRPESTQ